MHKLRYLFNKSLLLIFLQIVITYALGPVSQLENEIHYKIFLDLFMKVLYLKTIEYDGLQRFMGLFESSKRL
jgi:hypothetical protein